MKYLHYLISLVFFIGCNDAIVKSEVAGEGGIRGAVVYEGNLSVEKLGFALFRSSDYPPTVAPPAYTHVVYGEEGSAIVFPVTYRWDGVEDGEYYMEVYGDVDLEDTSHGPNMILDPYASGVGPILITGGIVASDVDVLLEDRAWQTDLREEPDAQTEMLGVDHLEDVRVHEVLTHSDVTVEPKSGYAAIYGTVAWNGEVKGKLMVLGFSTSPPSGPPIIMKGISNPVFPQAYSIDNVPSGTHYLLAYLDVDSGDGMTNNPMVDPASDGFREVSVKVGGSFVEDFWLVGPK